MRTSGGVTKPKKMVKRRDKFAAPLADARYRKHAVKNR
jgi:hypothetical protein